MISKFSQDKASVLMRTASRLSTPELAKLAMEFGQMAPEFKIVNFNTMDSRGIYGSGRFSSTNELEARNDIAMARVWVDFLREQYGASLELGFSLKNNILEMSIKDLSGKISAQVYQQLESLVVNNSLKTATRIRQKAAAAYQNQDTRLAEQVMAETRRHSHLLTQEAWKLASHLDQDGEPKISRQLGQVLRQYRDTMTPSEISALASQVISTIKPLEQRNLQDLDTRALYSTVMFMANLSQALGV